MNGAWVAAALLGLALFLSGLWGLAWRGQDGDGRWRPGAWRWLCLAAGGFALLAVGLHAAGVERIGLHYPTK